MSNALTERELAQFTGSAHWYRHALNRKVLFTDGAKYVADHAGAYWLLDEIALIQPYDKRVAAEAFQVWRLKINADMSAELLCEDGNYWFTPKRARLDLYFAVTVAAGFRGRPAGIVILRRHRAKLVGVSVLALAGMAACSGMTIRFTPLILPAQPPRSFPAFYRAKRACCCELVPLLQKQPSLDSRGHM
jgi:hypothetical protein